MKHEEKPLGPRECIECIERLASKVRSGSLSGAIFVVAVDVANHLWPYGHPKEISGVTICVIEPGSFSTLEMNTR